MEVILLEKIRNLGDLGDKVRVKPGFGRNFLIPYGKALPATAANVEVFEARKAELIKKAEESLSAARMRADAAEGAVFTVEALASEEGKLYGSVNAQQVVEAAAAQGIELEPHEVSMPDGVVREVGESVVMLHFHADVEVEAKLVVEPAKVS